MGGVLLKPNGLGIAQRIVWKPPLGVGPEDLHAAGLLLVHLRDELRDAGVGACLCMREIDEAQVCVGDVLQHLTADTLCKAVIQALAYVVDDLPALSAL